MKRIFMAIIALLAGLTPANTWAHVRYIANDSQVNLYGGVDWQAFWAPLKNPYYILLIVATAGLVLGIYWALSHNNRFDRWSHHMAKVGTSYRSFIPWIARLSLGIALIGAATSQAFISPVLAGSSALAFVQIVLGFFLMAGFMVGISAILTLILFIMALLIDPYLIGSFDFLALTLSILLIDSRRPGIDDIVGIPDFTHVRRLRNYLPTILRSGIGIAMIYLAIFEKFLNPNLSSFVAETTRLVDVIPVSAMMWTLSAGVIELLLGVFLLIGFKTRLSAVIAIFVLSLSFFYFGEDVTSHITLFGTLSAVFILGAGPLSVDGIKKQLYEK